ncbi:MAG: N-acetyltransferase [bacterium]
MALTPEAGSIRIARGDDVEEIAPLFDAYRQFYGAASDVPAAQVFLAARISRNESRVLIAVVGQGASAIVAGFAQLYFSFSSLSLGTTVILNDLFVMPEHRGRGLAGSLVDHAVSQAQKEGAASIQLMTQHRNRTALRLYRSRGFSTDSEFAHLTLPTMIRGTAE